MTDSSVGPYSRRAGEILRETREQAKLSLADAAVKMKASGLFRRPPAPAAIRSYEAGQRRLSLDQAILLAKFYGIPPARLLPREAAPDIDENAVAQVVLKLAAGGALQKIARILATGGLPDGLPPGGDVDLLDLVVQSIRAQQREQATIPTVDEPDGTQ